MMNTIEKFYNSFYTPAIKDKKSLKTQEIYNLYQKPKKDKGVEQVRTNRSSIQPNCVYQADVLFMPEDPTTKDKYILTVCDISAKGNTDTYAFKVLNAKSILDGFKIVFNRGILTMPKYIIALDKGAEFYNKSIQKYFHEHGVFIHYTQTGRSRQMAFAENRNKVIAKALFMRMTAQELLTDEPSLHWTGELPKVVEAINKHAQSAKTIKFSNIPNIIKSTIFLSIGTPVRLQLDKPREVYENRKLTGGFRETDVRWTDEIYTISDIILDGGQPPLYRVKDIDGKITPVAYTRNQLQVVKVGEQEPPSKIIRGTPTQYVVKKVHKKRTYKKKTQYLLEYKGYPKVKDRTWEDKDNIIKSKHIERLIQKFEKSS